MTGWTREEERGEYEKQMRVLYNPKSKKNAPFSRTPTLSVPR